MNSAPTSTRATLIVASLALLIATLTACGGDDASATDDAGATSGQPGALQSAGPGDMPGASGEIAAISGKTMQVQSAGSGQFAVTWTAKTTFSDQVEAALADVTVGSCVMVESDAETDAATDDTEPVAATAVRITEATDDGCGGFGGGPQQGSAGERPEGAPSDLPSDLPTDARVRMGGTVGEVVAVAADGFTVSATRPGEEEATSVEVAVDRATTYTRMADSDASALKVGRCATATGDTDSTGAVTADRISVTDPVDGECGLRVFSSRPGADQ
ncbi:DUF5666 domain-containing protein [Nocardioides sp.]|uniref:DUF5666 domain-containing protein n=1 Tax=Nocardioides sp. TaxID=35761 RepID=UPI002EDA086F